MDEAIRPINVQTTKQRIKSYSSNPGSLILAVLVGLAALITFLTLVFIIGYILVMGIPNLKPSLSSWSIIQTMFLCCLQLSIPLV